MKILLLLIIFFVNINSVAGMCPIKPQGVPENTEFLSMLSIITNGEKYNNKPISLTGILYINKDNQILLFNNKEAIEYFILKESIVLNFKRDEYQNWLENLKYLNGKYINLTGTFRSNSISRAGNISNIVVLCTSGTRTELIKNIKQTNKKKN